MSYNLAAFLGDRATLAVGLTAGLLAGLGWASFHSLSSRSSNAVGQIHAYQLRLHHRLLASSVSFSESGAKSITNYELRIASENENGHQSKP